MADVDRALTEHGARLRVDLKQFWWFLEQRELSWLDVTVERLGEFAAWLRRPAANVIVLDNAAAARSTATVNRALSAVAGLYEFHARRGVRLALDLRPVAGRSGWGAARPFLDRIAPRRARGRVGRLPERRRLVVTLEVEQVAAIIGAQRRLRDRLLFALLFGTGMRIGQALGLRHEDVLARERALRLVARDDNVNGARGKGGEGTVPVTAGIVRLLNDYGKAPLRGAFPILRRRDAPTTRPPGEAIRPALPAATH